MNTSPRRLRCVCLDWGNTLMLDDGPADLPMALWPEVHVVEGARELLAALAPRCRLAVATNASLSDRALVLRALERAGLHEHLSEVFCSIDVGARKDTPRFWEVVSSVMGVEPGEIAMLGDSLEQDVLAPSRFGVFTIWFNPDGAPVPAGLAAPVVRTLADVPGLLEAALAPPARR